MQNYKIIYKSRLDIKKTKLCKTMSKCTKPYRTLQNKNLTKLYTTLQDFTKQTHTKLNKTLHNITRHYNILHYKNVTQLYDTSHFYENPHILTTTIQNCTKLFNIVATLYNALQYLTTLQKFYTELYNYTKA